MVIVVKQRHVCVCVCVWDSKLLSSLQCASVSLSLCLCLSLSLSLCVYGCVRYLMYSSTEQTSRSWRKSGSDEQYTHTHTHAHSMQHPEIVAFHNLQVSLPPDRGDPFEMPPPPHIVCIDCQCQHGSCENILEYSN